MTKHFSKSNTRVSIQGRKVVITHLGRIYDNIHVVNEDLKVMGVPSIFDLKNDCSVYEEIGYPDSFYEFTGYLENEQI